MKLLDVVALTEDLPERGLTKGQVGTIVEQLAPEVFEVEFSGLDGKTYATAAVSSFRSAAFYKRALAQRLQYYGIRNMLRLRHGT